MKLVFSGLVSVPVSKRKDCSETSWEDKKKKDFWQHLCGNMSQQNLLNLPNKYEFFLYWGPLMNVN